MFKHCLALKKSHFNKCWYEICVFFPAYLNMRHRKTQNLTIHFLFHIFLKKYFVPMHHFTEKKYEILTQILQIKTVHTFFVYSLGVFFPPRISECSVITFEQILWFSYFFSLERFCFPGGTIINIIAIGRFKVCLSKYLFGL